MQDRLVVEWTGWNLLDTLTMVRGREAACSIIFVQMLDKKSMSWWVGNMKRTQVTSVLQNLSHILSWTSISLPQVVTSVCVRMNVRSQATSVLSRCLQREIDSNVLTSWSIQIQIWCIAVVEEFEEFAHWSLASHLTEVSVHYTRYEELRLVLRIDEPYDRPGGSTFIWKQSLEFLWVYTQKLELLRTTEETIQRKTLLGGH